jgi:hypothetical protein
MLTRHPELRRQESVSGYELLKLSGKDDYPFERSGMEDRYGKTE